MRRVGNYFQVSIDLIHLINSIEYKNFIFVDTINDRAMSLLIGAQVPYHR